MEIEDKIDILVHSKDLKLQRKLREEIEQEKKTYRTQIEARKQKKDQMQQQMTIIENYVQTQ